MVNSYIFNTIIGIIKISEENNYIIGINMSDKVNENERYYESKLIKEAHNQLQEYFDGKRKKFTLPLKYDGTIFQKKVWNYLRTIPYGTTVSYEDVAIGIDCKKACRAVGNANNKNKIIILVPCHRVIGKNKKLVGFGCGIDVKEKLLELEKKYVNVIN